MPPKASGPGNSKEEKLPRRDWILLPALGVLTICVVIIGTNFIAGRMFNATPLGSGIEKCSAHDRGIPNTVCWEKYAETQPIKYVINSCGHRAGMDCGSKPPATFRIVMVGTSIAMGHGVAREKSFAALLPVKLSQHTGRKIDLYNEAMTGEYAWIVAERFDQILAAKPDMLLWIITPFDLAVERADSKPTAVAAKVRSGPSDKDGIVAKAWFRIAGAFATKSIPDALSDVWHRILGDLTSSDSDVLNFQARLMLKHFLFQSQSQYVKSFLTGPDSEQGFLKASLSTDWRRHLKQFDRDTAQIMFLAKAAGLPVVAVLLPNRADAAIVSMQDWPTGYDPYKLDNELAAIISSHGGTYIHLVPDFRGIPNPEQYYLPVDGHPNDDGHLVLANLLARHLADSSSLPTSNAPSSRVTVRSHH